MIFKEYFQGNKIRKIFNCLQIINNTMYIKFIILVFY